MAAVSQFSTPENFAKLTEARDKLEVAIKEAQIAQQAGVPGSDTLLSTATQARDRTLQLLNTYFPGGVVSTT
jgi:hypothetical protein